MPRGIIYLMTTVVPGLIKIGKTGSDNFKQRMYNLEHDGYRNVTGFKRYFAIEVDNYDEKEVMLHNIFEKSRVADTELFAIDINLVVQLLSSFDGNVIYPKETKETLFGDATESSASKNIPDGTYYFHKKKKSDNKTVKATAIVQNGNWTLLKNSNLGITEDVGGSRKAKDLRATMPIDDNGILLEDVDLGICSPSFAGNIVMNQSNNGWDDWKNIDGHPIDVYRNKNKE